MDRRQETFLYFGNDWAAENRTSSHHIARWLAQNHRVYYIECPGLRAPNFSGRDLKKIGVKVLRFFRGTQEVQPGLKVHTLLQVPLHHFRILRWLNRALIRNTLRWLMWREEIRDPISWFMVPHLSSVVGELNEKLSVYYCIDDYASLPDVNVEAVRTMDEELTRKADVVFVASETLLDRKLRLNPNTHVSPHGVDFEHFAQAQDDRLQPAPDIASLPHPVIGFFGLIEQWIDLDLIAYLAERRPQWNFVMVGRVAIPQDELPRRSNIHFLGRRPYEQLPAYGKRFDVAIIPYQLTDQTHHANPIKLREYLAMGKPVVSVSTPEIDKYADVVATARSREEFLAKLDAAVANPMTADQTRRGMGRVASESWDARLQGVFQTVEQCLAGKTPSVPLPPVLSPRRSMAEVG